VSTAGTHIICDFCAKANPGTNIGIATTCRVLPSSYLILVY
jgi:hypothetical protein